MSAADTSSRAWAILEIGISLYELGLIELLSFLHRSGIDGHEWHSVVLIHQLAIAPCLCASSDEVF